MELSHKESKVKEKIAVAVGVITLALALVTTHVNTQVEISRLSERVDSFQQTNTQTIEVLNRLADSVEKLSDSVARLDERTRSLERDRYGQ